MRGAKISNAYMLVYVRVSDWPRLMSEPGLGDIAEHLRQRFQQEQEAKETRQRQKQEAHLYCTLKVATDADIARQVILGRRGGVRWMRRLGRCGRGRGRSRRHTCTACCRLRRMRSSLGR